MGNPSPVEYSMENIQNIQNKGNLHHIRSNHRVAQNGRCVIHLVHPGGGTKAAKILDFKLSESLKMRSSFAHSNYPWEV